MWPILINLCCCWRMCFTMRQILDRVPALIKLNSAFPKWRRLTPKDCSNTRKNLQCSYHDLKTMTMTKITLVMTLIIIIMIVMPGSTMVGWLWVEFMSFALWHTETAFSTLSSGLLRWWWCWCWPSQAMLGNIAIWRMVGKTITNKVLILTQSSFGLLRWWWCGSTSAKI